MDVGPEQALAHRDLAPHRLDDFGIGHEPLRVLSQEPKDRERLAAKPDLLVVLPEALRIEIQSEGGEGQQGSREDRRAAQQLKTDEDAVALGVVRLIPSSRARTDAPPAASNEPYQGKIPDRVVNWVMSK